MNDLNLFYVIVVVLLTVKALYFLNKYNKGYGLAFMRFKERFAPYNLVPPKNATNIEKNLLILHNELKNKTYVPKKLINFILRDPKTRKISKADFRDRVVHHSLMNIIASLFEKTFIYDSCAGRIGKGTIFALQRFEKFSRKVSCNLKNNKNKFNDKNYVSGYCLKADIKQYFQNINHERLISIIKRKIKDENVIWLTKQIINANFRNQREREYLQIG